MDMPQRPPRSCGCRAEPVRDASSPASAASPTRGIVASLGRRHKARSWYISIASLGGVLALAGCTSGVKIAEEACARSLVTAAAFADCLRSNYAALTGGLDQSDLGELYLAAAEYQAAMVAAGQETDAQAMLELASYRTSVLAPMEASRREASFKKALQAMQAGSSNGQGHASSGAQGRQSASAGQSARRFPGASQSPGW
jgi:hypothetical protein